VFEFLGIIFLGLIVGLFARFLMPGPTVRGFVMTSLLGIAGALVGRQIGLAFQWEGGGFLLAVLGAMLILFVYRLVQMAMQKKP